MDREHLAGRMRLRRLRSGQLADSSWPGDGVSTMTGRGDRPGLRVLIAAGGSGGHVFPGLALARTLTEQDPTTIVRFAGTSRGIETRAVSAAGFPLDLLPILPLFRRPAFRPIASRPCR